MKLISQSLVAAGLAAFLAPNGARAAQPDSLSALVLAAGAFVADQCPGLSVDEGLSAATLRTAGLRAPDAASPGVRAEVASWLTEWRGNPQAACNGLLTNFGPDGRTVRDLIRRTRKGA